MGSSYFCRICTLCVMSHSRILKMCVTGESLGKISQRVVRVTFFIVFSPYDQEKYMKERGGGGGGFFFLVGGGGGGGDLFFLCVEGHATDNRKYVFSKVQKFGLYFTWTYVNM